MVEAAVEVDESSARVWPFGMTTGMAFRDMRLVTVGLAGLGTDLMVRLLLRVGLLGYVEKA
jgi:hypothetical protein